MTTLIKDPAPGGPTTDGSTIFTDQHNALVDRVGGTTALTANRAIVTGAGSNMEVSVVTKTELALLTGITTAPAQLGADNAFTGQNTITNLSFPVVKTVRSTALTNSVTSAQATKGLTSGNMANGFGTGLVFQVEDATSGEINIGRVAAVRDGADNQGRLVFEVNPAFDSALEIDTTGTADFQGNAITNASIAAVLIDSGTLDDARLSSNVAILGSANLFSNTASQVMQVQDTGTNTVVAPFEVRHDATGATEMVNGFGVGMNYVVRDADNVNNIIGQTSYVRDGADNTGKFQVQVAASGSLSDVLTITSVGATDWTQAGGHTNFVIDEAGTGNALKITKYKEAIPFEWTTDISTGDGAFYSHIPPEFDGYNLTYVHAEVITAGTTGTTDIQIHNVDNALDMLSTVLTIDSAETGSDTAATPAVINTSNDHVNTNDVIRIDVDAVSTTAPKGLIVTMGFKLP